LRLQQERRQEQQLQQERRQRQRQQQERRQRQRQQQELQLLQQERLQQQEQQLQQQVRRPFRHKRSEPGQPTGQQSERSGSFYILNNSHKKIDSGALKFHVKNPRQFPKRANFKRVIRKIPVLFNFKGIFPSGKVEMGTLELPGQRSTLQRLTNWCLGRNISYSGASFGKRNHHCRRGLGVGLLAVPFQVAGAFMFLGGLTLKTSGRIASGRSSALIQAALSIGAGRHISALFDACGEFFPGGFAGVSGGCPEFLSFY